MQGHYALCFSKRDTNSFFETTTAGVPSAVTDISFLKSSYIFDAHSRKSSKISFPVVLPLSVTSCLL